MNDLEFHKKLIAKLTLTGVVGDSLHPFIDNVWEDARKEINADVEVPSKNTATDEDLDLFAEFIVQDVDLEGLVQGYKEAVLERLYSLTDEELQKEKEFYEYKV